MKSCEDCAYYDLCNELLGVGDLCVYFKDESKFIELPCAIGDITYAIAYVDNTRVIKVKVFQINIGEYETVIWIENTEDTTDFWKLTVDEYNEWARFSTRGEAEKKLEECKNEKG